MALPMESDPKHRAHGIRLPDVGRQQCGEGWDLHPPLTAPACDPLWGALPAGSAYCVERTVSAESCAWDLTSSAVLWPSWTTVSLASVAVSLMLWAACLAGSLSS